MVKAVQVLGPYSPKEFSAAGGEKNRYKDFVDCLRYLMTYDPIYVDENTYKATGGGGYL